MTVSFYQDGSDRNNSLTFYLARYTLNGTFVGFEVLRDQLNLCPINHYDVEKMMKFGVMSQYSCEFEISKLASQDQMTLPENANNFFDIFILDRKNNLVDVPVLVRNYKNAEGKPVNSASTSVSDSWTLMKRFFIFDTVSGIEGTYR